MATDMRFKWDPKSSKVMELRPRGKLTQAASNMMQSPMDRSIRKSMGSTIAGPPAAKKKIIVTKDGKRFELNNPDQLKEALAQGYTHVK